MPGPAKRVSGRNALSRRAAAPPCPAGRSGLSTGSALWGGNPFVALPNGTGGKASQHGRTVIVEVQVRDNNVDQALRALKKKMQREGLYREMRMRRHYEKPSERRAREKAEAIRRYRKLMRKRAERDEV